MSNILSALKSQTSAISICVRAVQDSNEAKKSYNEGDLTKLAYERKIYDNKMKFIKSATPMATTLMVAAFMGCNEIYEGYQNGVLFTDVITSQFSNISDLFNTAFDGNNKPLIEGLSALNTENITDYLAYVSEGTGKFLSSLKNEYVNTSYIMSLVGVYGAMNAVTGTIDFLSGDSKNMHKLRDYDTEKMKLDILRKHYHDPVFDSLNNEEMYSMMVTYNQTLRKYHTGKNKITKNIIGFIDKYGDALIKPFRKMLNHSSNNKDNMINAVYDYIENDINFDNPELTYKKYGLTNRDFKILSSVGGKEGGVTKKDMLNFVFQVNNDAMVSAYKMKLKDDTMLAFSLKLEEIARAPEVTEQHIKEMKAFKGFLSGYEKNKSHLQGLKLPADLKEMSVIIKSFERNDEYGIKKSLMDVRHKDYTRFLERNAPHLISRSDDGKKVEINNYSFLSYFEAEKERTVKSKLIQGKIAEYTEAKQVASEQKDRARYEKCNVQLEKLEKEAIKYHHIFGKSTIESENAPDNIMPDEIKKVSSIYKDPVLSDDNSVESFVINHMLKNEDKLLVGNGMKERGVDLLDAQRAKEFNDIISFSNYEDHQTETRAEFKRHGKKYKQAKGNK